MAYASAPFAGYACAPFGACACPAFWAGGCSSFEAGGCPTLAAGERPAVRFAAPRFGVVDRTTGRGIVGIRANASATRARSMEAGVPASAEPSAGPPGSTTATDRAGVEIAVGTLGRPAGGCGTAARPGSSPRALPARAVRWVLRAFAGWGVPPDRCDPAGARSLGPSGLRRSRLGGMWRILTVSASIALRRAESFPARGCVPGRDRRSFSSVITSSATPPSINATANTVIQLTS